MVLEAGIHGFECGDSPNLEWASASSPGLMIVRVTRDGVLEDLVYVTGPTHTWWSHNPLFNPALRPGEKIEIELTGTGAMRFECLGLKEI